MQKTIKSKLFIGATMLLALLLTGCPSPAGGGDDPVEIPDYILNNDNWNVINQNAVSYNKSNGVYTIDCKQTSGGFFTTYTSSEPITLTFKIKTHMGDWDGCMQFLIDDEVVEEYHSYYGVWQNQQVDIGAGTHTFEWKHQDNDPANYTVWKNAPAPFACLKDIKFLDKTHSIKAINNITDNTLNADTWIATGFCSEVVDKDLVLAKFPQYGDALIDTHKKELKLSTCVIEDDNIRCDNSSLLIKDFLVSEESALSFDYKCDLLNWINPEDNVLHQNFFRVFLDDNDTPVFEDFGNGQMWQKASIILSPGNHSVKFISGTDDGWYSGGLTNSVYLDNITLVPNTIASVDIYPKGLQETYVEGDTIQFTAKSLRADGSVIPDKTVSWSATGGSIDNNGLFTPGTAQGTFTITATIDGKTASNKTVKVHGKAFLLDPVTINGHTYTGKITPIDNVARSNTKNITFEDPTPKYSNFTTDGFFVLKGNSKDKYVLVGVLKSDDTIDVYNDYNYKYRSYYIFKPGDFEQRIWLRYGDGDYEITVVEADCSFFDDYEGYEGALKTWPVYNLNNVDSVTWFKVRNKTGLNYSADDSAYLMPSYEIQCDDFLITNAFNAVMAELPEDATLGQKLQALYDWEARRSHYDYVSFTTTSTDKRKRQDALHVLKYGMGVCEGYADLYTAFARLLGVKSAYQTSDNLCHAWTELYYKGSWKMVDITWDDPSETGSVDKNPTGENYWYFLIDPNDASHAKRDSNNKTITPLEYDRVTDFSRSAN